MGMKDGIKQWVDTALDVKDEIAGELIDAGLDPKFALKASTVVTKKGVAEKIDRYFGNRNAAEITHTISNLSEDDYLN
ncbi:hypothetical protein [Halomonas sp. PR-M31]|uniref:hypothetical protein n=1 Tax=Halomonas sp. PR-M31 TaxID=1471202 RepID=UPI000AAE42F1|nr:hypothetical protein [Halomonas sp. PR-M31]